MFKKIIASLLIAFSVGPAVAQPAWTPTKPIEIVVPYPPGGTTDRLGRLLSDIFNKHGWQSYVTNKPGANTTIASNYVAKADPDGHTVYASGVGFLDANLAFDDGTMGIQYTENDFTDIAPMAHAALVLSVNTGVPVTNYEEFKKYVRANPDKFNVGFWNAYIANVFYDWAKKENLPKPNIILYKGSAPMIVDLIGGNLLFAFDAYSAQAPYHKDGKVKIIASLDSRGYRFVKRVEPTSPVINLGPIVPSSSIYIWHGVSGPKNMPKEIVTEMNKVINAGVKNPEYIKSLDEFQVELHGGTPTDLRKSRENLYKIFKEVAKTTKNN